MKGRTFVVRPWVRIGPRDKLLVHPCEQANRRIRKAVANGLWLCRLLGKVTHVGLVEKSGGGKSLPLVRCEGGEEIFEIPQRVLKKCGGITAGFCRDEAGDGLSGRPTYIGRLV